MGIWTDTEKVTLDAAAKKELADLAAYRPAPNKETFVKGFGGMLAKVTFSPLDPTELIFQVVAQGFAMPLYAGRMSGKWVLVR